MAFCLRPWNEVEDWLRIVIANPQVPHDIKRACAWRTLVLSVHVGMRQQERQECQIWWLQEQVEKWEETSWALASELQRVCEEWEEMVAQLRFTWASLQQVLKECDVLCGWLLQVPPLAQDMGPGPRTEQFGAVAWPVSGTAGGYGGAWQALFWGSCPYAKADAAPKAAVYVPGPPSPWSQAMQPVMPMPRLYLFPYHAPLPMGSAFLPPIPPSEAEAAVVPFQMPSQGINLPGPLVEVGLQEKMAPLGNEKSYSQGEGPEVLQGTVPLGDIRSLNQEEGQERSQEMVPLGDSWSHSQEEGPERPQGMIPLGTSGSHSQEEVPRRPQGTVPLGDSRNQNQERYLESFQRILPLEYNRSHKQEDPQRPQGTDHLEVSRSQSQERGPERPQATNQGDNWSHDGRENPKKQQKGKKPQNHTTRRSLPQVAVQWIGSAHGVKW